MRELDGLGRYRALKIAVYQYSVWCGGLTGRVSLMLEVDIPLGKRPKSDHLVSSKTLLNCRISIGYRHGQSGHSYSLQNDGCDSRQGH